MGFAPVEAAKYLVKEGHGDRFTIIGVDLVYMHATRPAFKGLALLEANLHTWEPLQEFDLITCVHGLHYIGDKLDLIARAVSWLSIDGVFKANLDLSNLRLETGKPASKKVLKLFQQAKISYNRNRHILSCYGRRELFVPFIYQGADDKAGPNYTGQSAVNSYYDLGGYPRHRLDSG